MRATARGWEHATERSKQASHPTLYLVRCRERPAEVDTDSEEAKRAKRAKHGLEDAVRSRLQEGARRSGGRSARRGYGIRVDISELKWD